MLSPPTAIPVSKRHDRYRTRSRAPGSGQGREPGCDISPASRCCRDRHRAAATAAGRRAGGLAEIRHRFDQIGSRAIARSLSVARPAPTPEALTSMASSRKVFSSGRGHQRPGPRFGASLIALDWQSYMPVRGGRRKALANEREMRAAQSERPRSTSPAASRHREHQHESDRSVIAVLTRRSRPRCQARSRGFFCAVCL